MQPSKGRENSTFVFEIFFFSTSVILNNLKQRTALLFLYRHLIAFEGREELAWLI